MGVRFVPIADTDRLFDHLTGGDTALPLSFHVDNLITLAQGGPRQNFPLGIHDGSLFLTCAQVCRVI